MKSAGQGAEERFSEIYRALYGRVHAYAERRLGREAADEVAAETFLVAWQRLSDADREVLALVAWEELPVAEAARSLGCSAPVFSVRLHRARKRLEKLLLRPAAASARVSELSKAS